MEQIPILDLTPGISSQKKELLAAIEQVIDNTDFINGGSVKNFEEVVAEYIGVKFAVGLNSGTDALTIGLRSMGVEEQNEVVTTAFTFFATVESILLSGCKPVFVDIDPDTFNLDASKVEEVLSDSTRIILPVHLYGHAADMTQITALAEKHNLKVLEDNAQAFGGELKGKKLGAWGYAAAFSFFPSKNLGAFGDAGMLVTDSREIAERAMMLRSHGSKKKYYNELLGYNSRLDTIQAAVLLTKMKNIDTSLQGRRAAANHYNQLLSEIEEIKTPITRASVGHCYHQYTVRVSGSRRDELQAFLANQGIQTMVYYPVPLHKLAFFANKNIELPETMKATKEVLSLPIWPEIQPEVQVKIVNAIKVFLARG